MNHSMIRSWQAYKKTQSNWTVSRFGMCFYPLAWAEAKGDEGTEYSCFQRNRNKKVFFIPFEIPYDDKGRAFKFYTDIFGWNLLDIPEMDYTLIHAAQVDENNMVSGMNNGYAGHWCRKIKNLLQ
jgi:hypothetical protein